MSQVIYVPRSTGGTLILTISPAAPTSPVTLMLTAVFRSGTVQASYRDGTQEAEYRDGLLEAAYRDGSTEASYRDGSTTTRGR